MNIAMLVLRVGVGLAVAAHGAQKVFGLFDGQGIAGTAGFLETLGFRPGRPHAWLLGLSELLGGLALAAGLVTPMAAAAVAGVMLAAVTAVHRPNGFFAQAGGYEYPLVLAAAADSIAFAGPGRYSLDRLAGWHLAGTWWGVATATLAVAACAAVLAGRALSARWATRHHPSSAPGRPTPQAA